MCFLHLRRDLSCTSCWWLSYFSHRTHKDIRNTLIKWYHWILFLRIIQYISINYLELSTCCWLSKETSWKPRKSWCKFITTAHMAFPPQDCCLLVPSHYLTWAWFIVNWKLRNKLSKNHIIYSDTLLVDKHICCWLSEETRHAATTIQHKFITTGHVLLTSQERFVMHKLLMTWGLTLYTLNCLERT